MITLFAAVALSAPVYLDRVDVLSEVSGTWQHDELPRAGTTPRFVALRWIEQVTPVIGLPPKGLEVGLSLRTQTVRYERVFADPWSLNGGLQLGAGLPMGVVGGVAWRMGPVRLGGSLSVISTASWARPVWANWRGLPTLGIGFGPDRTETQRWMDFPVEGQRGRR